MNSNSILTKYRWKARKVSRSSVCKILQLALLFVAGRLFAFVQTGSLPVAISNASVCADTESETNVSALCSLALFAHSIDESYKYVDDVLSLVLTSPEWDDCLDEADTNEVEVLFPTMASVFACEMPSNTCGFSWTVAEREQAFGTFLSSLGHTNRMFVTQDFIRAGSYAFLCCSEKQYTNALGSALRILSSRDAPCKGAALEYLTRTAAPSDEMTAVVVSVQTNQCDFTKEVRNRTLSAYVEKLNSLSNMDCSIVSNAARVVYGEREAVDHLRAVDLLLLNACPDYVNSSNRLVIANLAMARVNEEAASVEDWMIRDYFSPITNQLTNALHPLPDVEVLRGL